MRLHLEQSPAPSEARQARTRRAGQDLPAIFYSAKMLAPTKMPALERRATHRASPLRRFRNDDSAVSVVIGALLLLGLATALVATWQTQHLPIITEEAEAAHMDKVLGQFARIRGELDRQTGNQSTMPITLPIDLQRDPGGLFDPDGFPGTLQFIPTIDSVKLSTNRLGLIEFNGSAIEPASETGWDAISNGETIPDIVSIRDLKVRVATVGHSFADDYLRVIALNATGVEKGRIILWVDGGTPPFDDFWVRAYTLNSTGTEIGNTSLLYGELDQSPFWFDPAARELRFGSLIALAASDGAFSIRFEISGLSADHKLSYVKGDAEGDTVIIGSSASTTSGWSTNYTGGHLVYEGLHQFYVNQELRLANGAMTLKQFSGSVMRSDPHLQVHQVGTKTFVGIYIPSLVGDSSSGQGASSASVAFRPLSTTSFIANVPSFVMNVSTDTPSAWGAMWNTTLDDGGLSEPLSEYDVTVGKRWARLTIYGDTTAPASTVEDIVVQVHRAAFDVSIEL